MKAVLITEPHVIQVMDVPMPVWNDYECLVKVKACGICSSTDLKLIHGNHPQNPKNPFRYPAILGHEAVGEIVEVGRKVRNFKLGDRVMVPFSNMGRIPDRRFHITYGAMTEYSVAPDIATIQADVVEHSDSHRCDDPKDFYCQAFPGDISYVDGAMILSFKETLSAVRNIGIVAGMDVLIYGDGSVGMGLAHFAGAYKPRSIVVVGHHQDRLERVMQIAKPTLALNAKQGDMRKIEGCKFDVVVDAVGSTDIIRQGTQWLKPGGKLAVVGVLPEDKAQFRLFDLPNNTHIMMLSYPYKEHRTHDEVIALMQSGFIRASDYYSHVMPMEDVAEGVRLLESREAFKVVLTMNGGSLE